MGDQGYDVVYFLNCKPVTNPKDGVLDTSKKWRSAVVHFSQAKLDTLNAGMEIKQGRDEFAWVTHENVRTWEGFMYGKNFVSFELSEAF